MKGSVVDRSMIGKAEDADAPLGFSLTAVPGLEPNGVPALGPSSTFLLGRYELGMVLGSIGSSCSTYFPPGPLWDLTPFREPLSGLHWSPVSFHELRVEYNFSIRSPVPLEKRWCADTEKSQAGVCVEARGEAAALEGLVWIFSKLKPNAEWKVLVYSLVRRDKRQSGGRKPNEVLG